MLRRFLFAAGMAVIVGGCSTGKVPVSAAAIDPARLEAMVKVLASDAFEGRAPGTPGEDKTVAYLIEQFQAIGIQPGGRDGQWTQAVPMMRTFLESPQLAFTYPQGQLQLVQGENIEVSTVRAAEHIHAEEVPLVFVGFGVTAPERDWDDYGDIDLTGKIAVYLVNDPDFAAEPGEPVAGRFGNRRMTYYGRWAYKYEEAPRRSRYRVGCMKAPPRNCWPWRDMTWRHFAARRGNRISPRSNSTGCNSVCTRTSP